MVKCFVKYYEFNLLYDYFLFCYVYWNCLLIFVNFDDGVFGYVELLGFSLGLMEGF